MDEVLQEADVISLHPVLEKTSYLLVNEEKAFKDEEGSDLCKLQQRTCG
ncbi:putative glycerate dehydrogenase [Helianthus annuus]|nr:putative glycerate dehydrogenase [Helianthus annuus]